MIKESVCKTWWRDSSFPSKRKGVHLGRTSTTLNIGEQLVIADAQSDLYQTAAVNVIRALLSCINKYAKLQEDQAK